MSDFFGEREGEPVPRDRDEITPEFWGGLVALVNGLRGSGLLTESFPEHCPDGGIHSCDTELLVAASRAEVPGIEHPLAAHLVPETIAALEFAEFIYSKVSTPGIRDFHAFPRHEHFARFDPKRGSSEFQTSVNRLFRRCGLRFKMVDGRVRRIGKPVLTEVLDRVLWHTGDPALDEMLRSAVDKFRDRNPDVRREALEELWDAFERIKTVLSADKRVGAGLMLDRATTEPRLRETLEVESKELTALGNELMIRHKEMDRIPIEMEDHVDYLFHRMFAHVWLQLSRANLASTR